MHFKFSSVRTAVQKKLALRPKRIFPAIWMENKEGDRWDFPDEDYQITPPKEFILQVSRFPRELITTWLKIVQTNEVENCLHKNIQPTSGWVDGIEGRECKDCYGTQIRKTGEPWPEKWDAHGSRELMTGTSSWPDDLVLAMVRPSDEELKKATKRYGAPGRILGLDDAIVVAGNSCERCLNALCHRYGLEDGYPRGSEKWEKARTQCEFCEPPKMLNWLMGEDLTLKVASQWLSSSHLGRIEGMDKKVKLSPAQQDFLKKSQKGVRAVPYYPPVKKLLSLGFIEGHSSLHITSNPIYIITPKGEEYLNQKA